MKLAILTSSRADFGIYIPLLNLIAIDEEIVCDIIVFGSHLSSEHGYTIQEINSKGFKVKYTIDTQLAGDSTDAINSSMAIAICKFSSFWNEHSGEFDFVFCLGDRYEMMAAVLAGIGYKVKFIHLHAGETTLGSLDNVYRHTISLCSYLHFTSTEAYSKKVIDICGTNNVFCVGALSLDRIKESEVNSVEAFEDLFGINLNIPTILFTYHPDIELENDFENAANELLQLIKFFSVEYQFILSTPNADASGLQFLRFLRTSLSGERVYFVTNLGKENYFTAMRHSRLLIGNSSSGIIEAASFGKYVVNIGKRQEGRAISNNVLNSPLSYELIKSKVIQALDLGEYKGENIYYKDGAAKRIIQILKSFR
jgi:GDP/UDP-N,N'-diacetylbacillosamine 2-epimerase (hydrolysing)